MKYLASLIFVLLFSLVFPPKAHAYLDPGTGSYFFQLVMAFFVGAAFAVKIYWNRISAFLAKRFSKPSKDERDNG